MRTPEELIKAIVAEQGEIKDGVFIFVFTKRKRFQRNATFI